MSQYFTPGPTNCPADQPTQTPFITPPPFAGTPAAQMGGVGDPQPQVVKSLLPTGSAPLYVFATNYTCIFNGVTQAYRPGVGYQLDPALLAFLNAQSAPITAV